MSTSDPAWSTPVEAHAARTDDVVLVQRMMVMAPQAE